MVPRDGLGKDFIVFSSPIITVTGHVTACQYQDILDNQLQIQ